LIGLIENAFKHGVMKSAGGAWIRLKVACQPEGIEILISNSWVSTVQGKGIGLENLKSQLSHLYPGRHALQIESGNPEEFSISLTLKAEK